MGVLCGSREERVGSPLRTAARARASPTRPRETGRGSRLSATSSAAGPPRPHSPRPRPRAAAAVTAAVPAAATAAAASTAATPDDDRAAILGTLRQRRKAARACETATRSKRRLRSGIATSQSARRNERLNRTKRLELAATPGA